MSAVVLLASSVAACDGASPDAAPVSPPAATSASPVPGAPSAGWPAPPLRLPSAGPGDACPVTEPRPWSDTDQASRVLGPGPLYPVADYFVDGVLQLRDEDREQDGTYTKKVRWIGSGYTGPVLVRAARIDAPGSATVTFSYTGEPRDDGHYAVLGDPESDLPATTTVSGPGCYAYQVDGVSFSVAVVFRAAPAALDGPS
ncbi:hypothetical protein ACFFMR_16055 [Micromonospora andamanensis]|uniref:Uncharacterized protein n=1 Tax=Micromonospora andamanensis TaxID=1287068 RepID=A0ABQ4HY07_9ACTN|nr:hypothetical protein [Micromonospora andamanensis]GIJ10530.1 hypothetical protein Van01_37440 [Micromonospora andamanensis]